MFFRTLALAATVGSALAQRPANISICDYYTTALLKNNTAANQKTLLTLVVNTAAIGNYTQPNIGITVPGILAPAMVNGTAVNLAPYFTGMLASTNRGGSMGISVNFLDGGGATPLMMNMPANDTSSNQYFLINHLYEYFGVLLGCSMQGGADYSAYEGDASQYEVHKFMQLSYAEVTYFIEQVGMSAASFGVATEDVMLVGTALMNAFGYRCEPPMTIVPAQGPQLQSICDDETCPLSPNATCASYNGTIPKPGNATIPGSNSTATSTGSGSKTTGGSTATGSAPVATVSTAAGATVAFSFAAVVGGLAAMFL
ncbi:uncharacterized protein K444DRAFT_649059 [Hyaloscypha bicolor E]|uniref:Uncharacterized protein n=1 Tax=Hyaloscypha bicolor E TaxID=1095630 RepID=A0A2J6SFF1_9HELO|nr:uncharacterized protein K444DRAFT_649059 [Hyaloscypha bicolor E]PMD49498.1 hypothetical protein K444DRAFT_649059 [Hyaloscypha bicolor E]